jgi:hypothetical protein
MPAAGCQLDECKNVMHVDYCTHFHQGREFIANGPLENGAFCTVFSENFHKF